MQNRDFFIPLAFDTPLGGPRRSIAISFGTEKKLGRCGYPRVEKFNDMYNRFDRIPACDRQMDRQKDKWTDRQTSCHAIVRAMHRRRAVKVEIFMTDL